ncbi:glycosyltransferase [Telmatospirillum siberiense]|uniref:glycosyltransferase n=1 Tax=Telmatospirillum siberiense TaxID=382514 RepID=UPI0011AEEF79|nr:glycosyltransferase [Telmatospirillum siberiense]
MSDRVPHLLVALTAHGFGHAAMTAPVVNALADKLPAFRLTLQSNHPKDFLSERFKVPFERIPGDDDFGLMMLSATRIDLNETAEAYRRLHDRLEAAVGQQADRMRDLGVDFVLSNIGYVPLLAAQKAGIPAMALSCLNWADIYGHYFSHRPEAAAVQADMLAGYRSAATFLQPAPAMPMPRLSNGRPIGPIAAIAGGDRTAIRRHLGVEAGMRLGLIAFGGVESGLALRNWPRLEGWRWLIAENPEGHPDMVVLNRAELDFTDALGSSDVVVTKPGYGTFSEAAVNGVPVLFVPRPDWPENPHLVDWLTERGKCLPIRADDLLNPDILKKQLHMLFSCRARPLVMPDGAEEGAVALCGALRVTGCLRK